MNVGATEPGDGELREGDVIHGRFRLDRRRGRGAVGEVWRATNLDSATPVALKLPNARWRSDKGYVARFMREAALARRVDSIHVVRVLECALSLDVGPYIVMELIEGVDLFDHIARWGPLPMADMAAIVAQLCVALQALHQARVFHRDVKAENIVLTTRGVRCCATLIDFGIARDARDAGETSSDELAGTPAYMSPERLAGTLGADAHADLWSVAVVAYQCLTAGMPFDDRTVATVCVAVNRGTFVAPGDLRDDVPPALDEWFRRAFARLPSERFTSASEMRESLIEACSPLPLGLSVPAASPRMASGVHLRVDLERDAPPGLER
jgi:serine/threonine-protein kinase